MEGSKGILDFISGQSISYYDASSFSVKDMEAVFKQQDSMPRRPFNILVSGYQAAVINNDKEKIAYYEREHRKEYVRKWRRWVAQYGIGVAKVIDWLEAYKNKFSGFGYSGNKWEASYLGLVWGEYGRDVNDYDNSYVSILVEMNADLTFKITLRGQDGYGYDVPKEKVLSERASYRSVLNQIEYFKRKYSNGTQSNRL